MAMIRCANFSCCVLTLGRTIRSTRSRTSRPYVPGAGDLHPARDVHRLVRDVKLMRHGGQHDVAVRAQHRVRSEGRAKDGAHAPLVAAFRAASVGRTTRSEQEQDPRNLLGGQPAQASMSPTTTWLTGSAGGSVARRFLCPLYERSK